ncbi:MAG: alpha/beta hydrolase [Verrucomicrobia bacterium]|nr:alpha/beta hydrolase [Verrucomicrobiota bacterium]
MLERHLTLPDGRRLAYAEFGSDDGHPVIYFHGSPSSRLEPLLIGDEALAQLGLRVISPDRPGIGGSDFMPRRGFSHWPADVAALADSLGWKKFSVWGYSGGAPYVAACAARIPERIHAGVIVSGGWRVDWPEVTAALPLPNRIIWWIARRAPFLLGAVLKAMAAMGRGAHEKELAQMKNRVAPPDLAWFGKPGRFRTLSDIIREAIRPGTRGAAWDMRLYARAFDFDLGDVRIPLTLFHGADDANYPLPAARRAAAAIPGANLVVCEHEAHLSMSTAKLVEVAARLRG